VLAGIARNAEVKRMVVAGQQHQHGALFAHDAIR
jgi:hypothetical protein